MTLTSLVWAIETVVRMSEAAFTAAEEAMTAARLANIQATSALAAARLALDLERRIITRREGAPPVTISLPAILQPGPDLGDGSMDDPKDPMDEPKFSIDDPKDPMDEPKFSIDDPKFSIDDPKFSIDDPKFSIDDPKDPVIEDPRYSKDPKDDNNNNNQEQDVGEEQSAEIQLEGVKGSEENVTDIIDIEDQDDESMEESEVTSRRPPPVKEEKKITESFCRNCKQVKRKCLNGKLVLVVTKKTLGMKVIGCSDQTFFLGKVGTVIGGIYGNVKIRWNSGSFNSYSLHHWGQFSFKFFCEDAGNIEGLKKIQTDAGDWLFVERLSVSEDVDRVWTHDQTGETHQFRFCASEDITVKGVGLRVKSSISKVTLSLCQDSKKILFKQDFLSVSPSSSVLQLRHWVRLSCDRGHLLVLTLHGGASFVGEGGQEFVSVDCPGGREGDRKEVKEVLFKFEDYKHRNDKPGQSTNVSVGLVDKIYFELQ